MNVDGFYGKKFDYDQMIIKSATSSTTSARFCSSLSAWCDCKPPDLDNLMFHIFTALKRKQILFYLIFMSGHPSSLAITRCSEDITVIENLNENKVIENKLSKNLN